MATRKGKKQGKRKKPEEPVAPPRNRLVIAAVSVAIIVILAFVLLQSGLLDPSGGNTPDETAALQVFNSFKADLKIHDGTDAIELTTLKFLSHNVSNTEILNFFTTQFSDQNLVFTANNVVALDKTKLNSDQQAEANTQISEITDQNRIIHIDEVVTNYVLITGDISITGIDNPPSIENMVIVMIGGAWYLLFGA